MLRARTKTISRHLTEYLKKTDRLAKTIVFCVDQEHADEMRHTLSELNPDMNLRYSDYVCRVTSEEGSRGRGHLSRFQDPENPSPVILTTSQLLTTGVDIPTCKNVVLARVVGSMTEFKQIIGRGTRVNEDNGKYYFTILDYTGSATRHFADPEFDGEPELIKEQEIDEAGNVINEQATFVDIEEEELEEEIIIESSPEMLTDEENDEPQKYYVDGEPVEIVHELVYQLDSYGKRLNVVEYTDYTADTVRRLYPTAARFREVWAGNGMLTQ